MFFSGMLLWVEFDKDILEVIEFDDGEHFVAITKYQYYPECIFFIKKDNLRRAIIVESDCYFMLFHESVRTEHS